MNLHFALAALLLSSPGAPQQSQEGAVDGRVVSAATGENVPNARMTLSVVAAPGSPDYLKIPQTFTVAADAKGTFVFERLEPKKYYLSAEAEGYVRQSYGPFELAADNGVGSIVVRMKQAGVVTGHIVSGNGPLEGMEVVLVRSAYDENGRKSFVSEKSARTDDRGEYRLFGIQPGSYYLLARAPSTPDIRRTQTVVPGLASSLDLLRKYGTVYYPGTQNFSVAAPFELKPGIEMKGLDLVMTEQPTYRVRGTVVDGATGNAISASIGIFPRNGVGITGSMFPASGSKFEMQNIAPGEYVLLGLLSPGRNEPTRIVRTNVDVVASDAENVVLTLAPLARVPGRLTVEGSERLSLESFQAQLVVINGGASIPIPGTIVRTHSVPDAEGSFVYNGVIPGAYELRFGGLPGDSYVKEATYGDVDVLANLMRIAGDKDNLQIVVSTKGGQIQGTLYDIDNLPASSAEVSLVPEDRSRLGLYRRLLTDGAGRFVIHGVPPGAYKLFSWDSAPANAYFDPDFVRAYEDKGVRVQISESSQITNDVQRIIVVK